MCRRRYRKRTGLVVGKKNLAKILKVHRNTVRNWELRGLLKKSVVLRCGRVIIYDMKKVIEELDKPSRGRIPL